MKKYTLVLLFIYLGFNSCSKVLDTTPLSTTTLSNALTTPTQANGMLAGIYNSIADGMYSNSLFHALALGNDESYFGNNAGTNAVVNRTQTNTEGYCLGLWNSAYTGIKNANLLLNLLTTSTLDSTTIKNATAEAKFLRGYIYFILVDNFGNVPLRLVPTTSTLQANIERASYPSCYNAIIKDLTDAEADLPDIAALGSGNGHPSKSAAQATLARVFLKMAGFPLNDSYQINDTSNFVRARYWAQKAINNGFHSLNPSFKQVFINLIQGQSEPHEVIWQINYKLDPSGEFTSNLSRIGYLNGPSCPDLDSGYCKGDARPMKILWDKYMQDTNDVRRDWSICPYYFVGATDTTLTHRVYFTPKQIWDRYAGKFRREYELVFPKIKYSTGENFPAIRYSEVLLMFAEADNEVNGPTQAGIDAVNQVRRRASAGAYLLSSFNQSSFRDMIKDERMRELCFEGTRNRDLIRWSTPGNPTFISIMQNYVKNYIDTSANSNKTALNPCINIGIKDYLLPIPLTEISNNALITQNPGY